MTKAVVFVLLTVIGNDDVDANVHDPDHKHEPVKDVRVVRDRRKDQIEREKDRDGQPQQESVEERKPFREDADGHSTRELTEPKREDVFCNLVGIFSEGDHDGFDVVIIRHGDSVEKETRNTQYPSGYVLHHLDPRFFFVYMRVHGLHHRTFPVGILVAAVAATAVFQLVIWFDGHHANDGDQERQHRDDGDGTLHDLELVLHVTLRSQVIKPAQESSRDGVERQEYRPSATLFVIDEPVVYQRDQSREIDRDSDAQDDIDAQEVRKRERSEKDGYQQRQLTHRIQKDAQESHSPHPKPIQQQPDRYLTHQRDRDWQDAQERHLSLRQVVKYPHVVFQQPERVEKSYGQHV